ncbi:Uncharacterised protein [Amycolatopsis camponoti]|uniref:Uncharacterized protein n=1 Tax=Amycolatopsis camponoti TaxID=2606593 RepID=A0A6I8LIB0_9PSEU|nr:Uncharacterised protein [Amycolatopsis camponoti]
MPTGVPEGKRGSFAEDPFRTREHGFLAHFSRRAGDSPYFPR